MQTQQREENTTLFASVSILFSNSELVRAEGGQRKKYIQKEEEL